MNSGKNEENNTSEIEVIIEDIPGSEYMKKLIVIKDGERSESEYNSREEKPVIEQIKISGAHWFICTEEHPIYKEDAYIGRIIKT